MDGLCAYPPEGALETAEWFDVAESATKGEAASSAYRKGCQTKEIPLNAVAPMDTGSLVFRQTAGDTTGDLE